jgi:hypothetical protein
MHIRGSDRLQKPAAIFSRAADNKGRLQMRLLCLLLILHSLSALADQSSHPAATVTVAIDASQPVSHFIPSHALGAGVDGHEFGATASQLSPENIKAMLSAGFQSLTYRLRTELAGEAGIGTPAENGATPRSIEAIGHPTASANANQTFLRLSFCRGAAIPSIKPMTTAIHESLTAI